MNNPGPCSDCIYEGSPMVCRDRLYTFIMDVLGEITPKRRILTCFWGKENKDKMSHDDMAGFILSMEGIIAPKIIKNFKNFAEEWRNDEKIKISSVDE